MSHNGHHKKSHENHIAAPASKALKGVTASQHAPMAIDQIRLRAYEISIARNGGPGDALTDWNQAEHEAKSGQLSKF
jgi:hypothetical protein